MYSDNKLTAIRLILEELREELLGTDSCLKNDLQQAKKLNYEEFGCADLDDTSAAFKQQASTKLAMVNNALERVASKGYGQCECCGVGIETKHLIVAPWITTCDSCDVTLANNSSAPLQIEKMALMM
ncbi:hypothetical protein [Vibrio agarivorans]|uniref:DksA C4-type domain-containing protein n=1 Tax=Vibrio agarivorans TaxID=153622 RepID=A0ABT7Y7B9_9VIBR|nr:hypothetical protein [Vibrio agarivorans]MDN2483952.1 hypothetical protein [Vibrio agarivorans]